MATPIAILSATLRSGFRLQVPVLRSMGLDRLVALNVRLPGSPAGAYGHGGGVGWQGLRHGALGNDGYRPGAPVSTFPGGFPLDDGEFEHRIGRDTLGNVVASGTEVIDRLGPKHVRTGKPIVYTSTDSVFQIAAHEALFRCLSIPNLSRAFELFARGLGVGRVIARPFVSTGRICSHANRHDYALDPVGTTLLDRLSA